LTNNKGHIRLGNSILKSFLFGLNLENEEEILYSWQINTAKMGFWKYYDYTFIFKRLNAEAALARFFFLFVQQTGRILECSSRI
jgi:hypothetical protein